MFNNVVENISHIVQISQIIFSNFQKFRKVRIKAFLSYNIEKSVLLGVRTNIAAS